MLPPGSLNMEYSRDLCYCIASLVGSRCPVSRYSSLIGCGANFG